MKKARHGNEILAVSAYNSIIFSSKKEACMKLNINHKTLDRLINHNLPMWVEGQEYWFDEVFEAKGANKKMIVNN
jgi:hypothetical protein